MRTCGGAALSEEDALHAVLDALNVTPEHCDIPCTTTHIHLNQPIASGSLATQIGALRQLKRLCARATRRRRTKHTPDSWRARV